MKVKKIAALVLVCVMLLSLSGCGMDLKLTTAVLKLNKVESVHMDVDGAMELSVTAPFMNESVFASVTGGVEFVKSPLSASADLMVNAIDEQLHVLANLDSDSGSAVLRYSIDGGVTWETQDLGQLGDAQEIDPVQLLEGLSEAEGVIGDFVAVGTEDVLGSEATRYDSAISGAAMAALMEDTGAEDALQNNLGTDASIDFSNLQDVKLSVWVDKASGMPVKGCIDMADFVQGILDNSMADILAGSGMGDSSGVSISLGQLYLSVTLSDFNTAGRIREPNAGSLFGVPVQSPLQVGSRWRGTIELSGHSGKGDLENGSYEVWGILDSVDDRVFFEIYDYEGDEAMESDDLIAILSFWAEIDGSRIVPVIGEEDAWLINVYLDESDTDELTFVWDGETLTADYFYYDGEASEACDLAFRLAPLA